MGQVLGCAGGLALAFTGQQRDTLPSFLPCLAPCPPPPLLLPTPCPPCLALHAILLPSLPCPLHPTHPAFPALPLAPTPMPSHVPKH